LDKQKQRSIWHFKRNSAFLPCRIPVWQSKTSKTAGDLAADRLQRNNPQDTDFTPDLVKKRPFFKKVILEFFSKFFLDKGVADKI
jgi:hypothetical protein